MNRALVAAVLLSSVPVLANAQPVTGFYLGSAGGANFLQDEPARSFTIDGRPSGHGNYGFDTGFTGLGSLGYGFGNGVRVELEGSYRRNDVSRSPSVEGSVSDDGREEKYGPMINALFDLDIGLPWLYPYVGAGGGYQWTHLSEEVVGPGAEGFRGGTDGRFAYQAMIGTSLPLAAVRGLSLTAEYRFLGLVGDHELAGYRLSGCFPTCGAGLPATSNVRISAKLDQDYNHAVLIGLRYAFDAAPPPALPILAAPAPVPAPEPAKAYLVFFDWDRAELSDRARQIIADAAHASMRVQTTRIEVDGYTDRSGTASYNQQLSLRRARAVASELVRDGVSAEAIRLQGFGENHPLVSTPDGVREPQNRRVEIVLR